MVGRPAGTLNGATQNNRRSIAVEDLVRKTVAKTSFSALVPCRVRLPELGEPVNTGLQPR